MRYEEKVNDILSFQQIGYEMPIDPPTYIDRLFDV